MRIRMGLLAAGLALGTMLPAASVDAAMSEDQVRAAIVRDFGVEVLRIRPDTVDGRGVFLVTIMSPGGDFNDAFQVNTLMVDAETGQLVPQFRHHPSGHSFSGSLLNVPNR
ncbi:MAG: PepSY domain-containing protein [Kiloniellales bacterium]